MAVTKTRLVKWGNSLAVRIPKVVLLEAGICEGDKLEFRVADGCIAVEPARRRLSLAARLARISPDNLHGEQNWGKPAGRETW